MTRERRELSTDESAPRARAIGQSELEAQSLDALSGYARDEGRFDDALAMRATAPHPA